MLGNLQDVFGLFFMAALLAAVDLEADMHHSPIASDAAILGHALPSPAVIFQDNILLTTHV